MQRIEDRNLARRLAVPLLLAAVLVLADCGGDTTTTTGPPTAFAVLRLTTAGAADTTFAGGRAIVTTDIDPSLFDFAIAVAIEPAPSNKILAAGSSGFSGQGTIALVRYNPDGTLDTAGFGTAGTGGIVRTPTPAGWTSASATAIAVQPADNKIVVAALAFNASAGTTGILLLRYNTSGALDTSFGTSGMAILPIGSGFLDVTCGLVLQADGKAVVVGASSDGKITLARYTTAGALDPAFGDNNSGITITDLGAPAGDDSVGLIPALGLQSTGQIVVSSVLGRSSAPAVDQVVLRYSASGVLDTSFGGAPGGIVVTDIAGSVNFPNAVAVQANDKIVVAGHANVNFSGDASDISLVRYNSDGIRDMTFGSSGIVTTDLGGRFDNALAIVLQPQAVNEPLILVSGNTGSRGFSQIAVLRYLPNGAPDMSFGLNGVAIVSLAGPSNTASGNAVALQPAGTGVGIVVAGFD